MDRDIANISTKLDAQQRMLQALADTQSDHTLRLGRLENKVDEMATSTAYGLQTIVGMLGKLGPAENSDN